MLAVSVLLEGEFGIRGACLSVPCIVSESGVEKIVESRLSAEESKTLAASADILNKAFAELQPGE